MFPAYASNNNNNKLLSVCFCSEAIPPLAVWLFSEALNGFDVVNVLL